MTEIVVNIENAQVFLGEKEVLHNINLQIEKGDKYFILGANGAGKTTLIKTILAYVWPKYGAKIELLGKTLGKTDVNELRKSISWVSPFLKHKFDKNYTVLDVILTGTDAFFGFFKRPTEMQIEKAKKILSDLNGTHLQDKNFYHLSSGEQMKVLLARALMLNPKLLILDEPNVYLDMKEREVLLSAVEDLAKENADLTIIFISQRIEDILPLFDKGMILKDGNIAIQGKREDVLTVENIKKAFDIEVELVNNKNGRLWAMIK